MLFGLIFALALIANSTALNILIAAEDLWVSAGARTLYATLKEQHNVILVAPLTQTPNVGALMQLGKVADIAEGGDFGHMFREPATAARGVRLSKRASTISDTAAAAAVFPDPEDSHVYGVAGSPLAAALVGLDYIIPYLHSEFVVDLIIAGPKEGATLDKMALLRLLVYSIAHMGLLRDIPTIAVLLITDEHYYYLNIPQLALLDYEMVNRKVSVLIDRLVAHAADGVFGFKNYDTLKTNYIDHDDMVFVKQLQSHQKVLRQLAESSPDSVRILPPYTAFNINFPLYDERRNMNGVLRCTSPRFVQSAENVNGNSVDYLPVVAASKTNDKWTLHFDTVMQHASQENPRCENGSGWLLSCQLPGQREAMMGCRALVAAITPNGDSDFNFRSILETVM